MKEFYEKRFIESLKPLPYEFTYQCMVDEGFYMDYTPGKFEKLLMKTGYRSKKFKESLERKIQRTEARKSREKRYIEIKKYKEPEEERIVFGVKL